MADSISVFSSNKNKKLTISNNKISTNQNNSIYQKQFRLKDSIQKGITFLSTGFCLIILAGIIGYTMLTGIGRIDWTFLSTATSTIRQTTGILGNIINTCYIIVCTLVIAVPLGIGGAIYLNEYTGKGKIVKTIEFTTETLAGIPSIIFGMFGMIFFGNVLGLGYSILTGAMTLTLMLLPLIIRTTQEALKTVPSSYREGAQALGATKWHMIRTVVLPSAMPGIITGILLAVGRIMGESAALLFTAGSGYLLPKNFDLFGKIFQPGGTLTIQMYIFMQNAEYENAFGVAVILLALVLAINIAAGILSKRFQEKLS